MRFYERTVVNVNLWVESTGAKPVLGPNCMIYLLYGVIQFGPKTGLALWSWEDNVTYTEKLIEHSSYWRIQ